MSQLVEALYPLPDFRRTPLSTLRWWESRRLVFNKAVGASGLVTLAGVSVLFLLPPGTLGEFSLLPMIAGSVVCGVEIVARAVWGGRAPDLGPILFRQGLIFSVGLTLFPMFLMTLLWVV